MTLSAVILEDMQKRGKLNALARKPLAAQPIKSILKVKNQPLEGSLHQQEPAQTDQYNNYPSHHINVKLTRPVIAGNKRQALGGATSPRHQKINSGLGLIEDDEKTYKHIDGFEEVKQRSIVQSSNRHRNEMLVA